MSETNLLKDTFVKRITAVIARMAGFASDDPSEKSMLSIVGTNLENAKKYAKEVDRLLKQYRKNAVSDRVQFTDDDYATYQRNLQMMGNDLDNASEQFANLNTKTVGSNTNRNEFQSAIGFIVSDISKLRAL